MKEKEAINANEVFSKLTPDELNLFKEFEKMHQELSIQRDKVESIILKYQKEHGVIDCENSVLEDIELPYDRVLRAITSEGYIDTEEDYNGPSFFDLDLDVAIDIVVAITSLND
jgi:hypothetical protein